MLWTLQISIFGILNFPALLFPPLRCRLRSESKDDHLPSVLDAHAWDADGGEDFPLNMVTEDAEKHGGEGRQGRRAWSSTRPAEICGISPGPCHGISFEVQQHALVTPEIAVGACLGRHPQKFDWRFNGDAALSFSVTDCTFTHDIAR